MIYIDQLTFKASILAYNISKTFKKSDSQKIVLVLDPIKYCLKTWVIKKLMSLVGITIKEADFFTSNLKTKDNSSIYITAKNLLSEIAHKFALQTVNKSKYIKSLNEAWGNNTILLYISKYIQGCCGYGGENTIFKILASDALSENYKDQKNYLILGLPIGISKDLFDGISKTLKINTYSNDNKSIRNNKLSVLLLIIYIHIQCLIKRISNIFCTKLDLGNIDAPALLLFQEDDLSMDHSYRSQPHWLSNNDIPPEFRTLILQSNDKNFQEPDDKTLKKYKIYSVPRELMYCYQSIHTTQTKINSAISILLHNSIYGDIFDIKISFHIAVLFIKASLLARLCHAQNVKTFMTCNTNSTETDAMNLIGNQMGINTISFQYSNMSEVAPAMMTTTDTMCTFSPLFHERWSQNGIQPLCFKDIGYLFDSSFDLVQDRAKDLRMNLLNNGSEFIICYFDENVQHPNQKYGYMCINDHYQEISTLANLVIRDPTISVIIKTQFRANTPGIMFKDDKLIQSAKASGRFVELFQGKHRNIILPAEPAMAADIVIGHAVGATAGLEAALTGTRCLLLNPFNIKGANINIFNKANILYNSMDSALSAVTYFRQNRRESQNLGSWTPIIDLFDSFQDKDSARRLREIVEAELEMK